MDKNVSNLSIVQVWLQGTSLVLQNCFVEEFFKNRFLERFLLVQSSEEDIYSEDESNEVESKELELSEESVESLSS